MVFPKVMMTKPYLSVEVLLNKQRCSNDAPNTENKIPPGSFRLSSIQLSQGYPECPSLEQQAVHQNTL